MTIEIQFLASLMDNPYKIDTLDREVSSLDFSSDIYYNLYVSVVDFVIEGKQSSYPDLKFKYKESPQELNLISKMEKCDVVDLQTVYKALIAYSQREKLKELTENALDMYGRGATAVEIQTELDSELLRIKSQSNIKLESVNQISPLLEKNLKDRVELFKKRGSAIELPTGISRLDDLTLGLHKKNMWIIGASTSDGKTQLAVQIAYNIVENGNSLIYYLLEDDREQVLYRFISHSIKIPISKIRSGNLNGKELTRIHNCIDQLKTGNRLFVDDISYDINDVISKTKFAKIKYPNLSTIVIDYIGLMMDRSQRFSTREQEISFISKKLMALSKECNIAVLCLAQLNTAPDDRSSGMPIKMNDLRDSKAPGHDSAVTVFIHYPFKYKKAKDGNFSKEYAQLILSKNRYGECNKIIDLTNRANVASFVEGIPAKFEEEE